MMPPRILHDQTLTIRRITQGEADADGVPTTTTTDTSWEHVAVQQVETVEHNDNRATTVTTFRASGPIADIDPTDVLVWEGATYRVVGKPDTRRGKYRINHTSLRMQTAAG